MGLAAILISAVQNIQLASLFLSAGETSPQGIINEALQEVIELMPSMCANEGQLSVIENDAILMFIKNTAEGIQNDYEWEDVDLGDYMDFVGEIVTEGNIIMENAFAQAKEMEEEINEAIQEAVSKTGGIGALGVGFGGLLDELND
jgi:hypothetical protein